MANLYDRNLHSSAARALSSLIRVCPNATLAEILYLGKLLDEETNLTLQGRNFPICNELLYQEISRVTGIIFRRSCNDVRSIQFGSLNLSYYANSGWNSFNQQPFGVQQGPSGILMTKKFLRVDVPVDSFPGFNFVGRLLGPRGNSLKRIEARTGCRIVIKGRGSMKDPEKEERLRNRPGLAHLKEPLHVLIEAESPANVVDEQLRQAQEIIQGLLKPVSKSWDIYKWNQLQELAMLNSLIPEATCKPCQSGVMKGTTRQGSV